MQQQPAANLSADFLFPKLHGMWSRSLVGEALHQIIRSRREESLARALAPLGIDTARRAEVQCRLVGHMLEELATVRRLAGGRVACYYAAFMDRCFFENLKTVLHYVHFPEQEVPIEVLLIDSPHLPSFDPEGVRGVRNTNQLFGQIPQHECREQLLPLLVELEDTQDMFAAECRLDQMYFASLLTHARRLPLRLRKAGVDLVRREIDTENLIMLMRNAELYEMPVEQVLALCSAGGLLLEGEALAELADAGGRSSAAGLLPKPYRRLLEPIAEAELYRSENALWSSLCGRAREHFNDYQRPARAVAAYPYLKHFEVLNVGRVFEGLHFGLSVADIESMMIETH